MNTPGTSRFGTEFETVVGRYYDGSRVTVRVLPRLYASPHFDVSAEYEMNSIRFPDRNEKFLGQLLRLRINTAASTRLSFNGFIQYNTAEKKAGVNLRFRYNPVEGTDLYFVFNEALNTDRLSFQPVPPLTGSRSFTMKYVRTFEF